MIDWLNMKIRVPHQPFPQDIVLKLCPDGEVKTSYSLGMHVEGSHSSSVRISSKGSLDDDTAEFLYISGNPSKFLQGHNVIGSDDLLSLGLDLFKTITETLNLSIPDEVFEQVRAGEYEVSLIDINYLYDLGTNAAVESWIKAAELHTRTRNGRPVNKAGTVYWNKNSRRWALKAYNKLTEITKGKSRLHSDFLSSGLIEHATGKLRIELRLLQLELKKQNLTRAKDLSRHIKNLYNEYIGRLVMPSTFRIPEPVEHDLPGTTRLIYQSWLDGHDVSQTLSKSAFYRHRKTLLQHGIDISVMHDRQHSNNVIPLIRPLEAKPVGVPQWAIEQGLVHQSAINF